MFDIITFGSATQDIMLTPKHVTLLKYGKVPNEKEVCFPMGSKIDLSDMVFNSGGGGTNTAAGFALQGFKTAYCGTIGSDISGQEIIDELKKLRVDVSLVQKTDKKRTNHSIIILNGGQDRTILAYRGAAEVMQKKDIPFDRLKTRWLYLAPLTGLLCDNFEALVDFANQRGINIAINPSLAQLSLPNIAEILKKVNVLFLNQEEASFLTKIPFADEQAIGKKINELHPGISVMTRGGDGVAVFDGGNKYSARSPRDRKIVDTTGAGDSFASGFLSEFIRTADIEKSVELGMANSIGNLSAVGAKTGLLKKGQAFEKVEVKKEEVL